MRITHVESLLLRLPLMRSISGPGSSAEAGRIDHIHLLVINLDTDAGHRGLGFAYTIGGAGRALKVLADDDLTDLLVDEDPLDHERLGLKYARRFQSIGRTGLLAQVYSAVDLALWDLKGKAAGLPLYKLLGGARESAPIYAGDPGLLWMSPEEIVEAAQPYLEQGMMGIKIKVGSDDPEQDAERVSRVRESLGEDVWLAVDANQRYNYGTALSMGHFFEEEIGADWFEEPILCEDVEGYARLAERLEIPIAGGESLFSRAEFDAYLGRSALEVVQPDMTRLGGLTATLKVAALADLHHRPVAPHLMHEVAIHLACGLPGVQMVEYTPWLSPAFAESPAIVNGKMVPSQRPGLGLEIHDDAPRKYAVEV
jgi:L-alanine-DL-glutamate epimerase-like enolase superfamily enzyme